MLDIKAMAVECGAFTDVILRGRHDGVLFTPIELEKFAQLVAMECASEVESCAVLIDHPSLYMGGPSNHAKRKAQQFADAIRARFGLEG